MRKTAPMAIGLVTVLGLTAAACGDDDSSSGATTTKAGATTTAAGGAGGAGGKIGVILPDSKSSARWETADRKFLDAAIKAAGFEAVIQNGPRVDRRYRCRMS